MLINRCSCQHSFGSSFQDSAERQNSIQSQEHHKTSRMAPFYQAMATLPPMWNIPFMVYWHWGFYLINIICPSAKADGKE